MTNEDQTVLMIKGLIAELPPAEREQCEELVHHINLMIKNAGQPVGTLALALVGAEMQQEAVRQGL